jgi:dUTP pyrophosphatase
MDRNMVDVKIKKLYDDVKLPKYQTSGSSGMDVHAYITKEDYNKHLGALDSVRIKETPSFEDLFIKICPKSTVVIQTGLSFNIPEGYEIQVRSRSGMSIKGITVANSPGTIDADFVGSVCIILSNNSLYTYKVSQGDRIAQLVLQEVPKMNLIEVDELEETERGENGFGSTGI